MVQIFCSIHYCLLFFLLDLSFICLSFMKGIFISNNWQVWQFFAFEMLSLRVQMMIMRQSANIPSDRMLNIQIARWTSAVTILIGYSVSAKLDYSRYYLSVLVDYADGVCSKARAACLQASDFPIHKIILQKVSNLPFYLEKLLM